ncbi:MAG TPA: IclR family transcriptional regulator C-terminal domain-containing protein, partial [Ramlibacter sp.]
IAGALGYPASSTFALLNTLRDLGYLDYARDDRTFVPTVRAALLGIWVNDALMSDGTIVRLMYDLRDATGGTAVLAIQSGLQVQYIHVVKGTDSHNRTDVTTGALRPLLRSAMGDVLLALKPRRELRTLVARANAQEAAGNQVRLADLSERLDKVRERGYAWSEGMATPGSGIIAMLLAAPAHQPPMALGLGGRISMLRSERERLLASLRKVVTQHRTHMEALPQVFAGAGGRMR